MRLPEIVFCVGLGGLVGLSSCKPPTLPASTGDARQEVSLPTASASPVLASLFGGAGGQSALQFTSSPAQVLAESPGKAGDQPVSQPSSSLDPTSPHGSAGSQPASQPGSVPHDLDSPDRDASSQPTSQPGSSLGGSDNPQYGGRASAQPSSSPATNKKAHHSTSSQPGSSPHTPSSSGVKNPHAHPSHQKEGLGSKSSSEDEPPKFNFLGPVRQVTLAGRRAGEGYFSKDGHSMVFQSERIPENPFYQIFLMNMVTGAVSQVSPGVGKTTCSWIHPNGDKVLFSSTHGDPQAVEKMKAELELRASGKERRYAWDYDEYFDLYEFSIENGDIRKLTTAIGYDAEASWSPDGEWVVFASNRRAFSEEMTEEEKAHFKVDASYMIDVYRMRADGSQLQRLTSHAGYDGGPFFSPDGKQITWRRFDTKGERAEIWTMNADGTEAKALTSWGVMSWAPYYHPSGDYIIFTTNRHGFANFELYILRTDGKGEPVRVTHEDGFDGLPVFTPDGATLVWTTSRTPNKQGQLFAASWDDAKARTVLGLSAWKSDVAVIKEKIVLDAVQLEEHVQVLTSSEMEGRLTGTAGEKLATDYVRKKFVSLGLEPGVNDQWFEPFSFTSRVNLKGDNQLVLQTGSVAKALELDKNWRPIAFSQTGTIAKAGVIFAGYGIVAPEEEDQLAYDAYGDIDVADKWVMVFRFMPSEVPVGRRQYLARFSTLRYKAMEARDRGAKGLLVVSGPRSKVNESLVPLRFDATLSGAGIMAVSISDEVAAEIVGGKERLEALQAELDKGVNVQPYPLPDYQLEASVGLEFTKSKGRNVVARLRLGESLSAPPVVIGAHIDHLGRGEGGDSLAKEGDKGKIHHGADDNASGVAGLLEIARYLVDRKREGALKGANRDVMFVAWSGEELGLYGSNHFVKQRSEQGLSTQVMAYLNMDMIGRLRRSAVIQGAGSSPQWTRLLEEVNTAFQVPIRVGMDTYLPTDATPFYLGGVPILSAFTGAHSEYHTPNDTADKLNYEGIARVAGLMGAVTEHLAVSGTKLEYQKVPPPKAQRSRRLGRAYIGTIPDYIHSSEDASEGVKLSGVAVGGPAEQAGVQGGDILVGLGGQPINNIYDFVRLLDTLKVGETTVADVIRNGEKLSLDLTVGSRQ